MLLQPIVENSIRHGIRNKKTGEGLVEIKFIKKDSELICIVEDNGIGRRKAHELKSSLHVEYQSKGISITTERINILNRQTENPISVEVIDLTNSDNQPAGTRVVLHFPA